MLENSIEVLNYIENYAPPEPLKVQLEHSLASILSCNIPMYAEVAGIKLIDLFNTLRLSRNLLQKCESFADHFTTRI